jgi:hypothetical protein
MKNIQNIETVLARMAELLRFGAFNDWANALEKFRGEIANAPSATVARILSMYGGMGSLNDLILHRNGQPLVAENVELDALRSELYQLCHKIS